MTELLIGESFVGSGRNAAHVNTVLGDQTGPAGAAWATALATPRQGHVPFVVVLQPGLAVRPFTVFVNKAPIAGDEHSRLTWGAAQAGVAGGVAEAVAEGTVTAESAHTSVLIAAVWVDPAADDEEAVHRNNREATLTALRNSRQSLPAVADVLAARAEPANPFFRQGQR